MMIRCKELQYYLDNYKMLLEEANKQIAALKERDRLNTEMIVSMTDQLDKSVEREKVKEAGGDVISVEGEETGEWVLVDLGDIVVHVMQPAIRSYYNLEEIWGGKPVRVKLGAPSRQDAA